MDDKVVLIKEFWGWTDNGRRASLSLKQLARDHELLYLRGAFVYPQRPHISVQSFDHAAANKPRTAVDLNGAVDNSSGGFGRKELGLARFTCDPLDPGVL